MTATLQEPAPTPPAQAEPQPQPQPDVTSAITPTPSESPPPAANAAAPASPSSLPDITAKVSSVTIVKRSQSSRVYLIQNQGPNSDLPAEGRVVLFKNTAGPVMGGLVLKIFLDKNQFAVKNVRDYGNGALPMQPDQAFTVLEKLSDYIPPAAPTSMQDKADLKEIAPPSPSATSSPSPVPEMPPAVADASAPPPPPGDTNAAVTPTKTAAAMAADSDDDDDGSDIAIEEVKQLDKYKSWLTAELAFLRNTDSTGTTTDLFAGGGIRYGLNIDRKVFFSQARLQDSLAAELGIFYYKIVNFSTSGDSYSVVPIIPTLRYNLTFSEEFTWFFYGGIMFNFASGAGNAVAQVTSNLNATQLAIGTGVEFRLGPNFDGRVDLGYDMLGLGLVLRF